MDAEYLAEIKARAEAATHGNWNEVQRKNGRVYLGTREKPVVDICNLYGKESEANMLFIMHARTDILVLLAEVESLRTALKGAEHICAVTAAENATLKKALELMHEFMLTAANVCERPKYFTPDYFIQQAQEEK